jgi:hypothetical protein
MPDIPIHQYMYPENSHVHYYRYTDSRNHSEFQFSNQTNRLCLLSFLNSSVDSKYVIHGGVVGVLSIWTLEVGLWYVERVARKVERAI